MAAADLCRQFALLGCCAGRVEARAEVAISPKARDTVAGKSAGIMRLNCRHWTSHAAWANVGLLRRALTDPFCRFAGGATGTRASNGTDAMSMSADSSPVASRTPARKRRSHRKARKPYDGRFVLGRRVHELVDVFRARIGPDADDPVMSTAIRRCAETVALSEDLRARMLRGEAVSADDVLRTTRAADALTRRLHLDRRNTKQAPTLAAYLAARGGQP
jgi:hypothetical protein